MIARLKALVKKRSAAEVRYFGWAAILCALAGWLTLTEPLDDGMRILRDRWRAHDASGQIAAVMIDVESINKEGNWPWPRNRLAALLDSIRESGARRVFITPVLAGNTDAAADAALVAALGRWEGRAVIASQHELDPVTNERLEVVPAEQFQAQAQVANANLLFDWKTDAIASYFGVNAGDLHRRSLAAISGNYTGSSVSDLPIDFAIRLESIKNISANRLLNEPQNVQLAGKDVFVGLQNDRVNLPGLLPTPRFLAHLLAAETLLKGSPNELDWFYTYPLSLVAAFMIAFARRRTAVITSILSFSIIGVVSLTLDSQLIFSSSAPSVMLITSVIGLRMWFSARNKDKHINSLTGMPNLLALRNEDIRPGSTIVAVKVVNYAEISAALSSESEKQLALEIGKRLSSFGTTRLYHGDEGIFAWVATNDQHNNLTDHIDALHAFFLKPVVLDGWQIDVAISFGLDATEKRDVSSRFSSALSAAGEAAKTGMRWKHYDPSKLNEVEWTVSLMSRLDSAIQNGEIWVAYQPKLDLRTKKVNGLEALVRWSHPERGNISPDQFVLAAEQNGRIDRLTYFVLEDALLTIKAALAKGLDLTVAVNLSVRMLEERDLLPTIRNIIARHGVDPARLIFEVTESAAVRSETDTMAALNALNSLGVSLSVDDYGTGYSTMDYLKKINATEIKIDKGFISAIGHSRSDRVLVHSTIELAHTLGRKVVAEGVEDFETLDALSRMGCDIAQGFFIARPMRRDSALLLAEGIDLQNAA